MDGSFTRRSTSNLLEDSTRKKSAYSDVEHDFNRDRSESDFEGNVNGVRILRKYPTAPPGLRRCQSYTNTSSLRSSNDIWCPTSPQKSLETSPQSDSELLSPPKKLTPKSPGFLRKVLLLTKATGALRKKFSLSKTDISKDIDSEKDQNGKNLRPKSVPAGYMPDSDVNLSDVYDPQRGSQSDLASPLRGDGLPPLAMFSSDEDIIDISGTPKLRRNKTAPEMNLSEHVNENFSHLPPKSPRKNSKGNLNNSAALRKLKQSRKHYSADQAVLDRMSSNSDLDSDSQGQIEGHHSRTFSLSGSSSEDLSVLCGASLNPHQLRRPLRPTSPKPRPRSSDGISDSLEPNSNVGADYTHLSGLSVDNLNFTPDIMLNIEGNRDLLNLAPPRPYSPKPYTMPYKMDNSNECESTMIQDENEADNNNGSHDSGIQQDGVASSTESLKSVEANVVRRPQTEIKERPKSDIVSVKWSDSVKDQMTLKPNERKGKILRQRAKTDLGGPEVISKALAQYEQVNSATSQDFDNLEPLPDFKRKTKSTKKENRRLSTPHPIKVRQERTPPTKRHNFKRPLALKRCNSAPDIRTKPTFNKGNMCKDDVDVDATVTSQVAYNSDNPDVFDSEDETKSSSSNTVPQSVDQKFDVDTLNYAEALWDHVTMDTEELCFRAGDVITVTDMSDKDWWWGGIEDREGWFPAAFVRIRVNQEDTTEDIVQKVRDGVIDQKTAMRRYSVSFLSKDQARANVVNEIINAEREYVKHLRDVVEGYIRPSKNRADMFSEEIINTIYGNTEEIYAFATEFLEDLDACIDPSYPHLSQIGQVFLKHRHGFEIYSHYCNNHPQGCEQLKNLRKNEKYQQFFEACRLLQQMIQIPLEGFMLTPVQKICKYPLQLQELLKYTRAEHRDYKKVKEAHTAMKDIAVLINERKRKIESIEKLAIWQQTVEDWDGPGILETSCELIYTGELHKVNSSGWSQERMFFLFDHTLIYTKKDVIWRNGLSYKGRIDMDSCEIVPIDDGKDSQFNTSVKHGWKIHDKQKDKWYLIYGKSAEEKTRWLRAFHDERNRVKNEGERENALLRAEKDKILLNMSKSKSASGQDRPKGKASIETSYSEQQSLIRNFPSHATLPRGVYREELVSGDGSKKKWFGSWNKKNRNAKR
ncbi:unnamed protein product [Owenia fusiformis]|uniref:Rho guanine nucleotide exchange factor 4 n=1 Tax=Owenia fusiformis TaxID=6347 RepID=A0A8S4NKB5_OWEFU|nr:unnamed protein product [Owenia fusiformis]